MELDMKSLDGDGRMSRRGLADAPKAPEKR